jgi:hypothetical protein
MVAPSRDGAAGFGLAETMVATALLAGSLAALGQLFTLVLIHDRVSRDATRAAILAQQKLEELRASPPGSLGRSPAGALTDDTLGFVDYFDAGGNPLAGGDGDLPAGTRHVRRWSVEPLPDSPVGVAQAAVLQVVVIRPSHRRPGGDRIGRAPGDARLFSIVAGAVR